MHDYFPLTTVIQQAAFGTADGWSDVCVGCRISLSFGREIRGGIDSRSAPCSFLCLASGSFVLSKQQWIRMERLSILIREAHKAGYAKLCITRHMPSKPLCKVNGNDQVAPWLLVDLFCMISETVPNPKVRKATPDFHTSQAFQLI